MRNLLRLLFPRRWRPGPCYADLRAAAERHYGPLDGRPEALCYECACREPTRAAWWRWVYALRGEHRCARCGRVFAVRRVVGEGGLTCFARQAGGGCEE